MVKYKIVRALSAAVLLVGSGAVAPAVWADEEFCEASNLEELKTCLSDDGVFDITTTGTIVVSGETTSETLIVKGNQTINGAAGQNVFSVENGASLTLGGHGVINAGRYGATVDGAELIIDGVTINATNTSNYGVYALNNGRVTMLSGMVDADYAAFAGNNTTGDMNFYIEGGILRSERYPAIYMPGQVDLVMHGGTLEGGIVARMGQIAIEGGTINEQTNPVDGDGIDQNYSSMPSVAGEAITLLAGTYKSANGEHGNDMNVIINGDNVKINGDVVLYDFGNTASGYAQDVNVEIINGRLTGFETKFTEEEIGFDLRPGYEAGGNNAAGRIDIEISGGEFDTLPDYNYIKSGYAAYDGFEAPYIVTTIGRINLPDTIYLNVGETYDLTESINESGLEYGTFNEGNLLDYVTVSDEGIMTAIAPGTATIYYGMVDAYGHGLGGRTDVVVYEATAELDEGASSIIDAVLNGEEVDSFEYADDVTAADLAEAADNEEIVVAVTNGLVDAETLEDEVIDAIADEIETSLGDDAEIAGYYDINIEVLWASDSGTTLLGYVTELSNSVTVTVTLPSELPAVEAGYTRAYYMICYHDGETRIIDAVDNGDGTVSFDADSFSTYALAYVDAEEAEEEEATVPNTGTMTAVASSAMAATVTTAIVTGVIAAIVSAVVLIRRKMQNR